MMPRSLLPPVGKTVPRTAIYERRPFPDTTIGSVPTLVLVVYIHVERPHLGPRLRRSDCSDVLLFVFRRGDHVQSQYAHPTVVGLCIPESKKVS